MIATTCYNTCAYLWERVDMFDGFQVEERCIAGSGQGCIPPESPPEGETEPPAWLEADPVAIPYRRLAAAVLARAVKDIRADNGYADLARRFLETDWAAAVADLAEVDLAHLRRQVTA